MPACRVIVKAGQAVEAVYPGLRGRPSVKLQFNCGRVAAAAAPALAGPYTGPPWALEC